MSRRVAPLTLALILLAFAAQSPAAHASRALLSEAALHTEFPQPPEQPKPPQEGEIEGACGLAVTPDGALYVSDYYHGFVDRFGFESPIHFPYGSQAFVGTAPEGPCGLALDSAGDLYVNVWHQRVERIAPTPLLIDTGHATGIAVDPATDYLYVDHHTPDHRSYVSVYESSGQAVENGGQPLIIGLGSLEDAYGLAAFGGRLYVADAGEEQVKVYEPAKEPLQPAFTITGFTSLTDAALAVDSTNGHLLVVDDTQPGYEHPLAAVREFTATGAALGTLPGRPVFGKPSGIAVNPTTGALYVTDGNSEESNVFSYGPYQEGFAPLVSPSPTTLNTNAVADSTTAAVTSPVAPSASSRAHRRHRRRHFRHHHKAGGKK